MLLKKKHKKTVTQVNRDKSPPSVWGDILYLVSKASDGWVCTGHPLLFCLWTIEIQ